MYVNSCTQDTQIQPSPKIGTSSRKTMQLSKETGILISNVKRFQHFKQRLQKRQEYLLTHVHNKSRFSRRRK